jgi:predicted acylesterase/phospholipase RssA
MSAFFKAFEERGVKFDILGGASVGAAVLAGFALLLTPAELDLALKCVFHVKRPLIPTDGGQDSN